MGSERRRRWVYATRNSEYHTKDDICVAVRDLRTGAWVPSHRALRRRLEGGVRVFSNGAVLPSLEAPRVGDSMYFHLAEDDDRGRQLVTSRLQEIRRPKLDDLDHHLGASAPRRPHHVRGVSSRA